MRHFVPVILPFFICLESMIGFAGAAAVIPGFAVWSQQEKRYILTFHPLLEISGDPVVDTRELHSILENVIREYPGQWLWIHRRWKTHPPGEPGLY